MKRFYFLFFLVLLSCSSENKTETVDVSKLSEKERWEYRTQNTEIIRDDFGVPHVYGKTDADAVFGLLYAQCEDDFNRIERNYIWAIGRLAEVEGEEALYSDLRARLYMTQEEAEEKYNNSPKWLKDLCVAFADGINFYLYKHQEVKPKLITHFEPWMPFYFSEGSIGGDIERVSTEKIREFYEPDSFHPHMAVHDGLIRLRDDEPRGSNGFAISGAHTKSGNAMLLINPHTSFFFRGEVHMVSEEGLNAYGAVTWGQFFVYQGFNERTGWMHTSTGTDIIDEFEETIINTPKGRKYKYGTEQRSVDSIEVTLKFKSHNGTEQRTFMTYRTHHGPVTHAIEDKWIATALMWKPVKALQQSFLRTKNASHAEFRKMMDMRTNSSNNTVYADADGNIAYYHGNFIPKRNTSFDYTHPVDGSNPATDWNGLHTVDENIFVLNPENGWIQNCNSTPFTCCGKYSPKAGDYPEYMTSFPENYRGIHAIQLLNKVDNLTLDQLIDLAYDPYLPGAEELSKGITEAFSKSNRLQEYYREQADKLSEWNHKVSLESTEMTLIEYYLRTYYHSGKLPEETNYMEKMRYMSSGSAPKEREDIFRQAIDQLKNDFGKLNVPWGEFNRYQRINGAIEQDFNDSLPSIPVGMASGRWGALASFGARRGTNTIRQYGVAGNSFIAVVEFGEKVKAKTLLAGGQSGDPESKHFDDQAERYASCKFKPVAFYKKDVLKRAEKRYHPGSE